MEYLLWQLWEYTTESMKEEIFAADMIGDYIVGSIKLEYLLGHGEWIYYQKYKGWNTCYKVRSEYTIKSIKDGTLAMTCYVNILSEV